ncbi:DNA glycosylase [Leucogyrophana mollusca]|uniref:DNA glycosylase n=1 Tax=Leucogyrophana mollusca TaxID=85980 RepID=A0ACB8BU64_9AGAM|nr:DNA glycosylase [Leucogyrophana mollusca]
MSAAKRSASTRAARLAARASPYHASVTLFEAADALEPEAGPSAPSPRRSKRIKLEADTTPEPAGVLVADLEDAPKTRKVKAKVKAEATTPLTLTSSTPVSHATNSKSRSPKKAKLIPQSLEIPHPPPPRWKETYDMIKDMRSHIVAPVDTMGCDQAQFKEQDPKNQRFATLVSLMLSSQTKDEVTDAAVTKLREAVGGTLSVNAIIAADESAVSEAIAKVGFWRRKTQYIRQTAQRLRDDFDSDVPKTVDELCSLPGVGPKMAFLALQVAWKLNVGIGVDVHVHRITNRLGWHRKPTKNPEETRLVGSTCQFALKCMMLSCRLNLQSWLPTELHPEINHLLVGFGQMICLPVGPRCNSCQLSTAGLCPSAQKTSGRKTQKILVNEYAGSGSSGPKVDIMVEETVPKQEPGDGLVDS